MQLRKKGKWDRVDSTVSYKKKLACGVGEMAQKLRTPLLQRTPVLFLAPAW